MPTPPRVRGRGVDVVLVSMPFGPLRQPSLGLSLLKAGLTGAGIDARIFYGTLAFARLVGARPYQRVESGYPQTEHLVGEWIFASSLFDGTTAGPGQFFGEVLRPAAQGGDRAITPAFVRQACRMRASSGAFLDECLRKILRHRPRIVGFSSVFQQQVASLALARRLKARRPDIFIVFGGANCEGAMGAEVVRQFPFVDAVVSGEGDIVFPQLVDRVRRGQAFGDLAGVYARTDPSVLPVNGRHPAAPLVRNMDELPYPDFSDYFRQYKASRFWPGHSARVLFETSRGCWWGERMHCTFCGLNGGSMTYRSKTSPRALAEVSFLAHKYRPEVLFAVDNILDLSYFKDFLPRLAARGAALDFFYEVKSNLKKEQVRLLRDAHVTRIQPGIESLSTPVLRLMRKGVSALQNIQLLKWCREFGIDARWNVLWGFPGEDPAEYGRMTRLVPLLSHLTPPKSAGTIRLDRFSPNFESSTAAGFINVRPSPAYRHIYPLEAAAVGRLAYFFTFDYATPQPVAEYTAPLLAELGAWQAAHAESALFFVDDGVDLRLWDERPCAARALTVLDGIDRTIYLACDEVRGLGHLQLIAADAGVDAGTARLDQRLRRMCGDGLMIREGDSFLALAIPVGAYRPDRRPWQRMKAGLVRSARSSSRRKEPA